MDVSEWQKRLEDRFTVNGVVGENLLPIFEQERVCGEYFATKFHGQCVLIDSFQSFFIETINKSLDWVKANGWPKDCDYYPPLLIYFITTFRSFRACENLLIKGYPLDGYALLRDLKDRCILLAGIAHNLTTFPAIFGIQNIENQTVEQWRKIKNSRKKEEKRVFNLMIRRNCGLPDNIVKELEIWEQLFHEEVHGSKFSFFSEMRNWIVKKEPLSVGPLPKEDSMAMYMNRSCEIGWLLVRLMPYIQPDENVFGDIWIDKYRTLDDSFRYMQQGLEKLGKKIGEAFIKFVDDKFKFRSPFYYFEADGAG